MTPAHVRSAPDHAFVCSEPKKLHLDYHVHHLHAEAFRGQRPDGSGIAAGPSLESGVSNRVIEVEEKLVGEAADGRRLAEGETEADSLFHIDAFRGNGFVLEQLDKAAAAGMGPDVATEERAKLGAAFKGDLTLPDPFEDVI